LGHQLSANKSYSKSSGAYIEVIIFIYSSVLKTILWVGHFGGVWLELWERRKATGEDRAIEIFSSHFWPKLEESWGDSPTPQSENLLFW